MEKQIVVKINTKELEKSLEGVSKSLSKVLEAINNVKNLPVIEKAVLSKPENRLKNNE